MSKPNTFKLGNTVWSLLRGSTDIYYCKDVDLGGCHLKYEELIKMGGVPVESKQIEKIDKLETPKSLPIGVVSDNPITKIFYKQREIVDVVNELVEAFNHLQKG